MKDNGVPQGLPSREQADEFRKAVLGHYRDKGRDFPWRRTRDPWRILVSEFMLQQTQTDRVFPRYEAWFLRFPDAASLATASLADVYGQWKGLGYNSRALRLRDSARAVCSDFGGRVPDTEGELRSLPGVGPYTARAVLAFAFNRPTLVLETNIRAALIFHFFPDAAVVTDRELEPVAMAVLDRDQPGRWYQALMDYGAWLKKREPNPSRKSAAYSRQSAFKGSLRQARGAILRCLSDSGGGITLTMARDASGLDYGRLERAAMALAAEGLVNYADGRISFSE